MLKPGFCTREIHSDGREVLNLHACVRSSEKMVVFSLFGPLPSSGRNQRKIYPKSYTILSWHFRLKIWESLYGHLMHLQRDFQRSWTSILHGWGGCPNFFKPELEKKTSMFLWRGVMWRCVVWCGRCRVL